MRVGSRVWDRASARWTRQLTVTWETIFRYHGPHGILARTWPAGSMTMWVAILLAAVLVVYYL